MFGLLGLSAPLLRAADDLGWTEPTPIQNGAIPPILAGRDLRGLAQTGSGKTGAFVLPILELLGQTSKRASGKRPTRALVLAPTRELAAQIGEAFVALGRHLSPQIETVVAVGGVSINPQMMALRGGADVVVATPGRLLDLIDQNALRLGHVELLVLDEADRLLSLGFADELARILGFLDRRQNLLFSATFPPAVKALADELLDDPVLVSIEANEDYAAPAVTQRAIAVDVPRRTMLLRHLLTTEGWSQVLVFVASQYTADHVVEKLRRAKIGAAAIHGGLSQGARTDALASFKANRVQVLVATDLAARGLHIAQLPAVVNYDLPRSPVDYLHRIGRTARAGESGTAVSFVSVDTEPHFQLIEKRHRLAIEREIIAGFEPVVTENAAPVRDPHGGIKGKRKSKKDKLREAAARTKP